MPGLPRTVLAMTLALTAEIPVGAGGVGTTLSLSRFAPLESHSAVYTGQHLLIVCTMHLTDLCRGRCGAVVAVVLPVE